jgi:MFS family permease
LVNFTKTEWRFSSFLPVINPEIFPMTDQSKPTASSVLKNYNFRLLWIGQGTSLLGDQFFMIAMPWLVLKITGDPLTLGIILALIGIPRAIFMLIGGATSDRFSPRLIMIVSDVLRLFLTTMIAIMIFTSWLQLWMLYVMALLFGIISGFFLPASGSMMPLLVKPEELTISNSIYQGTVYLSGFIGPVLAGGLIALFAHGNTTQASTDLTGIAVALAIDALTFLLSVITLLLMRWQGVNKPQSKTAGNFLLSIKEGIAYLWSNDLLRTIFILMVAANFLFAGPLIVGMPVISNTRLSGAASFGVIMGAYGGGNLLGIVLSSTLAQVLTKRMGTFMVGVFVIFGVGLGLMGLINSTIFAFAILFVMGTCNGMLAITLITSLQRKTPKEMLGRVMSLVSLAGVGLQPISQALTGAIIKVSLSGLFYGAGILMALVALWLAFQPVMHRIDEALAVES